ncbi:MAG TPA: GNAT family N-acetyltransferase [Chitinophagales bacterium]|nr:GNAT family N-acetyltransferase [Chitinophagales bacterium]
MKKIVNRSGSMMLKCVNEQEEIIGCVHLERKEEKLYLGMLTVIPELQNRGIGKQLLKAADEEARKQCCQSIYMTVISLRSELIAWYERHGYVNTQIKKPFPMDNPACGLPKRFLEFAVLEKVLDLMSQY